MFLRKYDLEGRLINFSILCLNLIEKLPISYAPQHFGKQLTRSSSSPTLHYGEAQAAESPADFIHKMKICLKELRESQINLKVILMKPYLPEQLVKPVLEECGELVAIFTSSIKTAKSNHQSKN